MRKNILIGITLLCLAINTFMGVVPVLQRAESIGMENSYTSQKSIVLSDNLSKGTDKIFSVQEVGSLSDYHVMACTGKTSWSSFAWSFTQEIAGFIPAGKFQKVYDKVYLVFTKAYQLGTRDYISLCWTVIDVICAFIPGAVPAKIFWSVCKLTPAF